MQNGLTMQADERDTVAGNRKPLKKSLDRRDMGVGHVAFERRLRRLDLARIRDDCAQASRGPLRVGESCRRASFEQRLAVAFNQRDVDPVHRRAADDADGGSYPLSPLAGRGLG